MPPSEISDEPGLTLNGQDIKSAESCLRGHKSRLYVCKCLANLYTCPKINFSSNSSSKNSINNNSEHVKWTLKFTGIPVLIHDLGKFC